MIEEPFDENLYRSDECVECEAELFAGQFPVFVIDAERYLCAFCATRRGGRVDGLEQVWRPEPEVNDLL